MIRTYQLLASFALGAVSLSYAQNSGFLHMAQIMTSAQLLKTGVSSLNDSQRKALDEWLTSYTQQAVRIGAATSSTSDYLGSGKHWVDEVCKDGGLVVLEDDSIWEIESTDRVNTALWLPTTNVSVRKSAKPLDSYAYVLRNTEDHETAHAKYLGTLD